MRSPARVLSLLVSIWLGSCRAAPRDEAAAVLGPDPEGCRSFAALGSVRLGESTGELRCSFDPGTAEHRCEIDVGPERVSSVSEYASLADFVEAGRAIGKRTSLSETRSSDGRVQRVTHRYDELGRVVRSIEEGDGVTTVTRYSDYDDAGRPRRAQRQRLGGGERDCGARLVQIEYSDAARTVLERSRSVSPERCGFEERTRIERYDAAGNRIGVEAADGVGVASLYSEAGARRSERVCL